ncbi:AMP_1a_G0020510.mRNA.1.CDS.1 [Saccharomyces cerevisiae]|nr:CPI_1c_G0019760.mRNA.1.CDS.1 [Saccharomyces cerevisiae]CAI4466592.1 AMP_1a_G0020510.mRNA.1.CDS.1 [Saccharomyces cerevisiae]CAI4473834.1 ADE_G0019490.mRNA.1.CDS.1 [Saccharomyces cerevisiae]CAI6666372.1 ADE_G0019490.mRNA.1.CDS.1 [Saccharomyces cerevisiae]CAI6672545.1 AMP_1a_G0020510.mRNA.1.CDS.1 [Saccharomyces cerevisiae]
MAPKKKSNDRAIQAKGSEAEQLIEDYLVSQYKPFSVNDIVQNLHNKVTKTTATKALENLVNEKRIVSKTFGKIIIYSCNEQDTVLPSNIDPSQFDFETVLQLRNDLIELERDKSMAKDALDSVTKEPENEDLLTIIENEENELKKIESKLKSLQDDWDPANDEIVKRIMSEDTLLQKEITKRSKICKNLIATIKDSVCPKNMNEFLEEIGFEDI